MKLRLFACLLVGAVVAISQASATPVLVPFLSVDVDGYNSGGGQSLGPTQTNYQGWELAEGLLLDPAIDWSGSGATGISKTFSTSQGDVTATLTGVGAGNGARNRGGNTGGFNEMYQDFVFAQRDFGGAQLGQNWIKLELAGLQPDTNYELTWFAREPAFNGADQVGQSDTASYMAYSDLDRLGGLDGPGAWMDANVGVDASYPPLINNGGVYANPIPTIARRLASGPDSLSAADPYIHAASFFTKTDGSGVLTAYSWSDGNSFAGNVQGAALINGFRLGIGVPEPTSVGLFSLGLLGIIGLRRRDG